MVKMSKVKNLPTTTVHSSTGLLKLLKAFISAGRKIRESSKLGYCDENR